MTTGLQRMIISTDDSHFRDFVYIVSAAWRKVFPAVKLTLAYVSDQAPLKKKFEKYFDDVMVFKPIEGIPNANLSKIARRYACTLYGNDVCMIEDIDTAPLNRAYFEKMIEARKEETLGLIGYEVYENTPHRGKVPSSNTFAESYIWKKAINPNDLDFDTWAKSFVGMKFFDHKEDVSNGGNKEFSDESLMRAILHNTNFNDISYINRNANPHKDWIDRSWWYVDEGKLDRNEYLIVNFMRPLDPTAAASVIKHIVSRMNFDK